MLGPANNSTPNIQSLDSRSSFERANNSAVPRLASNTKTESPGKSNRSHAGMPSRTTVEQLKEDPSGLHEVAVRYSVHKETGRTMIKIVDRENNEVIREIPSEEDLERSKRLQMYVGQLFDAIA